jgi:hypothetical protein
MKHKNSATLIRLFNMSDDFAIELESEVIKLHRSSETGFEFNATHFLERFDNELKPRAAQLITELNIAMEHAGWMDRKIARALTRDITRQLKVLESFIKQQSGHTQAA